MWSEVERSGVEWSVGLISSLAWTTLLILYFLLLFCSILSILRYSVGCIFAEMLTRKPFFRGDHPHHQLACIVEKLGCPSAEDMTFVTNPSARKAVTSAAEAKIRPLTDFLPRGINPQVSYSEECRHYCVQFLC